MVSRLGLVTVTLMDTVMLGRYAADDLAAYAIAFAPVVFFMSVSMGLMVGTLVSTSHAVGSGQLHTCGAIWQRSLPYALVLGCGFTLLSQAAEPLFHFIGHPPELAMHGAAVMRILSFHLPATTLMAACIFFLEGFRQPLWGTMALVIGNIIHFSVNFTLIDGTMGFPAMGAEGAAWATVIERWSIAALLLSVVWWHPQRHVLKIRDGFKKLWQSGRQQRLMGVAAGLAQVSESGGFAILALLAGTFGSLAVASWSILFNILALIFMLSLGIGVATSVRVGIAHGRGDQEEAKFAGWCGLGINSAIMIAMGLILWLFAEPITQLYTTDPQLIAMATPIVAFGAALLVPDGGQGVMNQATRGLGDSWIPTLIHSFSFFGVMLIAGVLLAFHYNQGTFGLAMAVFLATTLAMLCHCSRFFWLTQCSARKVSEDQVIIGHHDYTHTQDNPDPR
ncbi:MAG: MATE family efflux transporter [Alphaproteobacteria bacterium]